MTAAKDTNEKRIYIAGVKDDLKAQKFKNYENAIKKAGGLPCFDGIPEACDALLLPGGGDIEPWRYGQENIGSRNLNPARDELELNLLRRFIEIKKPVLGICRGIQVINVFFGGTLFQDISGHSASGNMDSMHSVHAASGIFQEICGKNAMVNSAHHQALDRLGEGLQIEQWAEDGVIEALRHETLFIWGVQWHPERLLGTLGEKLFRVFLTLL